MWPLTAAQIYQVIYHEPCQNPLWENLIIKGIGQDSRTIQHHQMFVAIKGEHVDGHNYLKACFEKKVMFALVDKTSPVLAELSTREKSFCLAVDDVLDALRTFAQWMRSQFGFPVIGVGGSNGKTTTKDLLYSMISGPNEKATKTENSENGFLGLPLTLLQTAHEAKNPPSALVLEIGIDEVGAMQIHRELAEPDVVLLTALGPEHLAGLGNWKTAAKEELLLFSSRKSLKIWQLGDPKIKAFYLDSLKESYLNCAADFAVVPKKSHDEYLEDVFLYQSTQCQTIVVWEVKEEKESTTQILLEIYRLQTPGEVSEFSCEVPLPGVHNAGNFALAFTTALALGRSPAAMIRGLRHFTPPPMRMNSQVLGNGALLFNDVYNASPLSMKTSLLVLENPLFAKRQKLVVLGDMLDLGEESRVWHEKMVPLLTKIPGMHLCLYGTAMRACYDQLKTLHESTLRDQKIVVDWLDTADNPEAFLHRFRFDLKGSVILVKGSRGMKLERLVKAIEDRCRVHYN